MVGLPPDWHKDQRRQASPQLCSQASKDEMSVIGALAPREAAICQSSIYDVDTPPGEGWTAFFEALDIVIIDTQNNRPTSLLYVEDLFKGDHYTPQWRYTISFFHPSTGWEYKISRKLDSGTYGAIWIFRQTNVVIGRPRCIVAKFYDFAYEAKVVEYVKEVERVERMNVVDRRRRGWVPDRVPAIVKRDDWGTPCLIMARQSGDLRGVIDTPPDVALNLVKALVQEVKDMFDIYGLIAYDTKPANFLFNAHRTDRLAYVQRIMVGSLMWAQSAFRQLSCLEIFDQPLLLPNFRLHARASASTKSSSCSATL